jgi:hypothetical protein
MKPSALLLAAILHLSALAWADPQPSISATPAPQPTSQVVQNSSWLVPAQIKEQRAGMRLVKPPAPKPEKKTPEIKFRDFRTARDAYPAE